MKKIVLSLIICFAVQEAFAQLTLNPGANANTLAEAIVGKGVTIANPSKIAPNANTATFDNGNSTNIGLTKGIILSTGTAAAINGAASSSANTNSNGAGFALLDPLAGAPTRDAARLEFDVTPTCEYLEVRFVFGTEEYPDYVGTSYNDAFGFFISGPNPDGGMYNNQNFALVPSTDLPISVNTINNGYDNSGPCTNCAYYNDNDGGGLIKYNGFTTPMTARVRVVPNSAYYLILAIADGMDGNEDAAVLIDFQGMGCLSSLPVDFSTFTGEKNEYGNLLKWATTSETNNSYFAIERSLDGKLFEEVGRKSAVNNGVITSHYEFLDPQKISPALYSTVFYRIRHVDIDGKEGYTPTIIHIENSAIENELIVQSVLKEDNILSFQYASVKDDDLEIVVTDASGVSVKMEHVSCKAGANEYHLPLYNPATGVLFLKVISSTEIKTSKLIKP